MIASGKDVFPKSSIKRLRFAFAAMAGLTLLALIIGCITFAFSHAAQKSFLDETAPLLVNIEELSKVAVGFSAASRELEMISTQRHLGRALTRYRSQNDRIQNLLLGLKGHDLQAQTVDDLNEVVWALEEHEQIYAATLGRKINAAARLSELRRDIDVEGQIVQDWLRPLTLDASLEIIELSETPKDSASSSVAFGNSLSDIQLLTDISLAVERFQHVVSKSDSNETLRELIAPEFRHLAQLASKLRDQDQRQVIAESLRKFNEKAIGLGGITDQSEQLNEAVSVLDVLNQQRVVLLTRMTNLVDSIVVDSRARFFEDAEMAQGRSLLAVATLVLFSTVAFVIMVWIGWRLINKDIALRLERLAASTIALADGNLNVDIDQGGSDELADMARATEIFRGNALELRRAEAELADQLIEVEGANDELVRANKALDEANAELAESELRYELIIRGAAVGIWDYTPATEKVFWSDRYKEILDISDSAFIPDRSDFEDRLHPDDRDRVIDDRLRHLAAKEPYKIEYRIRKESGDYVWFHASGQAIWDPDGNPIRMAGSVEDITERKRAEIALAQYASELERSNQELDDFAYIASHDLKEPLRAIYNHASFLLEDYEGQFDEMGEKRLNRLIMLSKRMEQLIADLLYFSRLGRGEQTMETLDLNDVVSKIRADLAETLTSQNVRVEMAAPLPAISGHPAHITSLFKNLINNAAKYNDSEEKVIEIGVMPPSPTEALAADVTLFVRDNGIGIEERFQTEIFRIFKRLNSPKAYGDGTGAGLTFAKKIVENHGGAIWLESTPGEGTTFFFTLKAAFRNKDQAAKEPMMGIAPASL